MIWHIIDNFDKKLMPGATSHKLGQCLEQRKFYRCHFEYTWLILRNHSGSFFCSSETSLESFLCHNNSLESPLKALLCSAETEHICVFWKPLRARSLFDTISLKFLHLNKMILLLYIFEKLGTMEKLLSVDLQILSGILSKWETQFF